MEAYRNCNVTRREEQLDQLCNLILLKLDSDKQGKIDQDSETYFRQFATASGTAKYIKEKFSLFIGVYPDIFVTQSDQEIRFDDATIHDIVDRISRFNFIDIGADTVSIAFQVLRSAALKQEEGQYFTPKQVIQAAIVLQNALQWIHSENLDIRWNATRILFLLSRNSENYGVINHQLVTLIDSNGVHIKNLIMKHLHIIDGITDKTKEYIVSKCKHDANFVVRMVCAEEEQKRMSKE